MATVNEANNQGCHIIEHLPRQSTGIVEATCRFNPQDRILIGSIADKLQEEICLTHHAPNKQTGADQSSPSGELRRLAATDRSWCVVGAAPFSSGVTLGATRMQWLCTSKQESYPRPLKPPIINSSGG